MDEFRLAILAPQTAKGDHIALHTSLTQAVAWLGQAWRLTKPADADFIFMLAASTKSLSTLQTLQRSYPIEKLIVASSIPIDMPQIKWHLAFSKQQNCPTILAIVNLLSRIQEHFLGLKPSGNDSFFEPTQHLAGLIGQCQQDGIARVCTLDNTSKIILNPKESTYYFSGDWEQLIPLALADIKAIKVSEASENELADETESINFGSRLSEYANFGDVEILPKMGVRESPKGNLQDLLWFSTLVAARGRTLNAYSASDKMILKTMPDILQLDYFSHEYQNLAALLIAKPISIIDAGTITGHSVFSTINFCNAGMMLKIIETI